MPQTEGGLIRFHVDHIRPRQHGGNHAPDNLALACTNCNWNKGPNLSAIDPLTSQEVALFRPRTQTWSEHFALVDLEIVGQTAIGRATVRLLRMNSPDRVEVRRNLSLRGELDVDG